MNMTRVCINNCGLVGCYIITTDKITKKNCDTCSKPHCWLDDVDYKDVPESSTFCPKCFVEQIEKLRRKRKCLSW